MKNSITSRIEESVDVHEIFKQITSALVGQIPIVGKALSGATGYLFNWLDGKPDPWVEFENKIERLITNKLKESESNFIRNSLSGMDSNFNRFLVDFENSRKKSNHSGNIPEFYDRIGTISDDAERLLPLILSSNNNHASAPYIEHFMLLSVSINVIGESLKIGTRDFSIRRRDLYSSIEKSITYSLIGAASERNIEIRYKNVNTSSDKRRGDAVYDYNNNLQIGEGLFGWPENVIKQNLKMHKSCAELVSIIELYRTVMANVYLMAKADKTVGYSAEKIRNAYISILTSKHKEFLNNWNDPVMRNIIGHKVMDSSIRGLANTNMNIYTNFFTDIPTSKLSEKS